MGFLVPPVAHFGGLSFKTFSARKLSAGEKVEVNISYATAPVALDEISDGKQSNEPM